MGGRGGGEEGSGGIGGITLSIRLYAVSLVLGGGWMVISGILGRIDIKLSVGVRGMGGEKGSERG